MVKPTFLCIGVQKSGTTSLIKYLSQHPDIFMKKNELHFFDQPNNKLTESEIIKYENEFETEKLIVGEKSPSYNYLQFAINNIYNYNPDIKLILILREPISRAFSQYNMNLFHKQKTLNDVNDEQMIRDFEEEENIKLPELKQNGYYYIARGKYDEIISFILSKFSRKNLYIGIAEEIRADKQKYYNDIISFLGAEKLNKIKENCDLHIRKYEKSIPNILAKKLYHIYKPHNERLYEILGRKIDIWENYYDELKHLSPVAVAEETPVAVAEETPVAVAEETPVAVAEETPVAVAEETLPIP